MRDFNMTSRINLFKQMRAFYSFVFNSEYDVTPLHSSLYMFLLNQNNRANWIEWFKCPADTAMFGALIHSNKTYYKVLNDLVEFGLIEVQKGVANLKPPKIKIIKLKYADKDDDVIEIPTPEIDDIVEKRSVDTTPILTSILTQLSTPILTQLSTQLTTLLPTLIDKQETIILITIKQKQKEIIKKSEFKDDVPKEKTWKNDFEIYKKELLESFELLKNDTKYIAEQQKYNSGLDIILSLEKAVMNYWITDEGWKKKKESKTETINWKSTLTKALSNTMNRVWLPRDVSLSTVTQFKNSKGQQLHKSEWIENGKRYFGERNGRNYEVPMGLPPRPSDQYALGSTYRNGEYVPEWQIQ